MKPRILVLGAGFAGHTAALHLSKHRSLVDITVVSPKNRFTWFPSLIWVGTGRMSPEECWFALDNVYARLGIDYAAGRATSIDLSGRKVTVAGDDGSQQTLAYDYLINATGPYLNFEGTPGLGPSTGNSVSVCGVEHAIQTRDRYLDIVEGLRGGRHSRVVIGTGHAAATCQGAAFEYIMNVDADLRLRGLRDRTELVWLSNEPAAGDFGVDGIEARKGGKVISGADVLGALMNERGIRSILRAGVTKVGSGELTYETPDAEQPQTLDFDFAMLIPQFRGIPMQYLDGGNDISKEMTQGNGFMTVDADYAPKAYEQYKAGDWPATYRSPKYDNVYAAGIAFAPPHPLSRAAKTPSGLNVVATVPRTGMASGIIGRTAALNVVDQVRGKDPSHHERMSEMPAACIASMGNSLFHGAAASIIMVPVARDYERYPDHGRDLGLSELDVGLGGAWTKRALHSAFMWKLQARPGWQLLPE